MPRRRRKSILMPRRPVKNPRFFPVDSIVCCRRVPGGAREYLVRWEGCDANTWEPERNLRDDGMDHYIQRYHALESLIAVCAQDLETQETRASSM